MLLFFVFYLCFQPLVGNNIAALKHTLWTHPPASISFLATFISVLLQFIIMAGICFSLIQIASDYFRLISDRNVVFHLTIPPDTKVCCTSEFQQMILSWFFSQILFTVWHKRANSCIYFIIISFDRVSHSKFQPFSLSPRRFARD